MIKFGILMKTYKRKKEDNVALVKRSIGSILKQTYQNYKLFLVGDRYEDDKEFQYFCSLLPKEKISYINLPIAMERDDATLRGRELWYSAGANATKTGVKMMKDEGFIYYARLDDDDYWYPNHLETLVEGYTNFPEAAFIYTNSLYKKGNSLVRFPPDNVPLKYDNLPPRPRRLIQSTTSWRLDKIDVPPRTVREQGRVFPGDADMWERVNAICKKNNYKTLYIPRTTAVHDDEGSILRGNR